MLYKHLFSSGGGHVLRDELLDEYLFVVFCAVGIPLPWEISEISPIFHQKYDLIMEIGILRPLQLKGLSNIIRLFQTKYCTVYPNLYGLPTFDFWAFLSHKDGSSQFCSDIASSRSLLILFGGGIENREEDGTSVKYCKVRSERCCFQVRFSRKSWRYYNSDTESCVVENISSRCVDRCARSYAHCWYCT